MSTSWHPDPGSAFWQSGDLAGYLPRGPERPGDRFPGPGTGDGDPEPPGGVLGPSLTAAEAIEVTGFGDPVRTFISGGLIAPGTIIASEVRLMPPFARTHRGQCQGCGTDDDVDIWSRCAYCAELAALRARNLPGPPLAWWWYLVPSVLGLCLGLVLVWVVLYVIFGG